MMIADSSTSRLEICKKTTRIKKCVVHKQWSCKTLKVGSKLILEKMRNKSQPNNGIFLESIKTIVSADDTEPASTGFESCRFGSTLKIVT